MEKQQEHYLKQVEEMPKNYSLKTRVITADPRITLKYENDRYATPGLQPFYYMASTGELFMQTELYGENKSKRPQAFNHPIGTFISRDGGEKWERVLITPDGDDPYFEGGMGEVEPGKPFLLETYAVKDSAREGYGTGEVWTSDDGFKTFRLKEKASFHMPEYNYAASSDDGGNPYVAARLHRDFVLLPNGDVIALIYGWFFDDVSSSAYMTAMKKSRAFVVISKDKGKTWSYLSTIAADPGVGTEGFTEPTLVRIETGPHAGRLLCVMRTGRDLYKSYSDDDGKTWSVYRPMLFEGLDPYNTSEWAAQFEEVKKGASPNYRSMQGGFVDPALIQMKNGVVVLTFGLRITEKMCWNDPTHPKNGNFIAFSFDGGDTFPHVEQVTSGVLTTHYTAVRETAENKLLYAYDIGVWKFEESQTRMVDITVTVK